MNAETIATLSREEILVQLGRLAAPYLGTTQLSSGAVGSGPGDSGPVGSGQTLDFDLRLIEDLGLDSISLLALVVEVENHFRVALEPEDEAGIERVGDLVDAIASRRL